MTPLETLFITHDTNVEQNDLEKESEEFFGCRKDYHVTEHEHIIRKPESFNQNLRTGVIEASERYNANIDRWAGYDGQNKRTKIKLKRREKYAAEGEII